LRRWGLFGGTFDPPHVGHLALAEWAREALRLDRVVFMPAGTPPHKRAGAVTGVAHRVAMTRLAVRGNPAFRVSTLEAHADGPSFTADTVARLTRRAGDELYVIIGADSLDDFRRWRRPAAILAAARLAVAGRPGAGRPATEAWARGTGRVVWIGNPGLDVSSSLVRARVRAGRSVRYLVPDAVARYLERHRLYGSRAGRRAG